MKTFSEFIAESEQQSGAIAAHLARTAAGKESQSGTVGGEIRKFKKRPSTGLRPKLPSLRRGEDKLKDRESRKPQPYRIRGERSKSTTSSSSLAKRASQSIRNAGKNTAGSVQKARVKVEPRQTPALKPAERPAKKRLAIAGTPQRSSLSPAKTSAPMVKAAARQAALKSAQNRRALPPARS